MGGSQTPQPSATVNPAALSIDDICRMLSGAGGRNVTREQVLADVDAGAPTNRDGTMNLVHYTAWLLREVQAGGD